MGEVMLQNMTLSYETAILKCWRDDMLSYVKETLRYQTVKDDSAWEEFISTSSKDTMLAQT